MTALLEGLKTFGPARLAAMALVGMGMLAFLGVLALRGGTERMALLYGDLDLREASQMADTLDRSHIPHQMNAAGSEILVPADQVTQARLLLAHEGLPSGGSIGYEIFDRGDGLMASQFQQAINQTRALEGELARTIRTISGVRAARVHLVLPKREPFARDRQDAQASVMLTLSGAARLDREGIQAVLNLIAAAVPGLRPQNIAIIDSRGNLLARAGEASGATAAALTSQEIARATELRLARAVEQMLEHSVGAGHVRAEAAVEMNVDQVHETQERFDPDGQVVRSAQSVTDSTKSTEANGTVSVQNNLPNADAAAAPGAGSQEQRQEETTNYEVGKTVRTLVREQPQLQRISLAVLVDGVDEPGPDGKAVWRERSPEELGRIDKLVRSAIGYDEKRGDHVEVVSMRFTDAGATAAAEPQLLFGLPIEKSDVMRLGQSLLLGIVGVLALLLVLRPMVLRLTTLPPGIHAIAGASGEAFNETAAIDAPRGGAASGVPRLPAPAGMYDAGGDEGDALISLSNVDGQLRMSSVRRVIELVEKHPDESLSIMRSWMQQEAG